MDERFDRLLERMRGSYNNSDPGHDFLHLERVLQSARTLGESVEANLQILLPAALLHDVVNVPKNHPDRVHASRQAAEAARALLSEYSDEEIARIQVVITEHSYSLGRSPSCIESAVMQDADRLDAIGAVGLMRMITCGALMGARYYDPAEPIAHGRSLDDKRNTMDHLDVKLFKLADGMHTPLAKAEAQRRCDFMRAFVAQLSTELSLKR